MSNPFDDALAGVTPPKPKPSGLLEKIGAQQVGSKVGSWLWGSALPDAAKAGDAVLSAPMRFVEGTILDKPGQWRGLYLATHPNDEAAQTSAYNELTAGLPKPKGDGLGARLGRFGEEVGVKTAIDPLTYAGGAGLIKDAAAPIAEKGLSALYKLAPKAEEALRPDALVRRALSPRDAAKYEGVVEREKSIAAHMEDQLRKTSEAFVAGKLDPIAKTHFLQRMRNLGVSVSDYRPQSDLHGVVFPASPKHYQDAKALMNMARGALDVERENNIANALRREGLQYIQQAERDPGGPLSQVSRTLSNLGKNALFINSVPHMGNVAVLTWLHGGEAALARGLRHFADPKFTDSPLVKELEHFGGTSHFSAAEPMGADHIPGVGPVLAKVRGASQGVLDRWETAMRAGRYEQLLKHAPRSAPRTEPPRALMHNYDPAPPSVPRTAGHPDVSDDERYWAAANVRRELGDYTNTSGLTRMLSDKFGAPFPQWRFVSVPQSVGRAAIASPHRVAQAFRAETTFNDDVTGDKPYEIESGKPPAEAAKMLAQPGKYALSPSSIGPLGTIAQWGMYNEKPQQILEGLASSYLPGASFLEPALGLSPFKNPAPLSLRESLSAVGAYAKKRTKPKPTPSASGFNPLDALLR